MTGPRRVLAGGLVLLIVLASAVAWPGAAPVSAHAAADPCTSRDRAGAVIGKVIQVVHGDITIGGQYVGAAPFEIRSRVQICTDARGQLIFTLMRPGGSTACNTLPNSRLVATPTLRFVAGTSWCLARGTAASFRGGSTALTSGTDTVFGVSVRPNAVIVKVLSGFVSVAGTTIPPSKQATLASPRKTTAVALTAKDRSAVAELSAALANER